MEQSPIITRTKARSGPEGKAEQTKSSLLGQFQILLTPEEVSRRLRVTSEQVRNLIRQGRISAVNVGAGKKRPLYRIRQQALDDFLDNSRQKSQPGPKKRFRRLPHGPDFFPDLK